MLRHPRRARRHGRRDHTDDGDVLADRLADAEVLVLIRERTRITDDLLERLPRLRMISLRSAYPHIDVDTCTRLGIVVSSNLHADTPSYATAELTWALVLAVARHILRQVAALRDGRWQVDVGHTLRGKLGAFSYGRIGSVVAGYGRAFMDVQALGRRGGVSPADERTATQWRRARRSCSPRVTSSRSTCASSPRPAASSPPPISRDEADRVAVNTSRAGLIAPGALEAALLAGRPGMAAVDVYETEPLTDTADPLLQLDNVVCTPHIGYVTRDEWELQFADVFDQIVGFAAGAPINDFVTRRSSTGFARRLPAGSHCSGSGQQRSPLRLRIRTPLDHVLVTLLAMNGLRISDAQRRRRGRRQRTRASHPADRVQGRRDVQERRRHTPTLAQPCDTTIAANPSTGTPPTSSPPSTLAPPAPAEQHRRARAISITGSPWPPPEPWRAADC